MIFKDWKIDKNKQKNYFIIIYYNFFYDLTKYHKFFYYLTKYYIFFYYLIKYYIFFYYLTKYYNFFCDLTKYEIYKKNFLLLIGNELFKMNLFIFEAVDFFFMFFLFFSDSIFIIISHAIVSSFSLLSFHIDPFLELQSFWVVEIFKLSHWIFSLGLKR
jgi:hypothetical protein